MWRGAGVEGGGGWGGRWGGSAWARIDFVQALN